MNTEDTEVTEETLNKTELRFFVYQIFLISSVPSVTSVLKRFSDESDSIPRIRRA